MSKSDRVAVWFNSLGVCQHCGKAIEYLGVWDNDHVLPKSKGGSNGLENRQMLCAKCNRSKGALDDEIAKARVRDRDL
ncbi:MAG: HNH endonuclease [bacterium]|nr:HNH endonuclease [bacterium]